MSATGRGDDREAINAMIYVYAEAVDLLGCHPVTDGADDPALPRAAELFGRCLTDHAQVKLYFEGPGKPATHAPSEGPLEFAKFVRAYSRVPQLMAGSRDTR